MDRTVPGLHHVTAIAGDPQRNLDFYTQVLGLRLVKRTVNFDDPGAYHFYFGDQRGAPGTLLTFFPWPGVRRGRHGPGQATVTSYSVPHGALGYWIERLARHGVDFQKPRERFQEEALALRDPDGLVVELVAHDGAEDRSGWSGGGVPAEHALRGFFGATLTLGKLDATAALLTEVMGFDPAGEERGRVRLRAKGGGPASAVDLVAEPSAPIGLMGGGVVHHVAWRARDDEEQRWWRRRLLERGLQPTEVLDRCYFHSIYFREPGGVLFEIATDSPGFTIDEPLERLGTELKLPLWFESSRAQIERALPRLHAPQASEAAP